MERLRVTAPVSAIVEADGYTQWWGWYISAEIPVVPPEEAPVVASIEENGFAIIQYRAYAGRLMQGLLMSWPNRGTHTTASMDIMPVRNRPTADTLNPMIGKHFREYPFKFRQSMGFGSAFISLVPDAEQRSPVCVEASRYVRSCLEDCVVIDDDAEHGEVWYRSRGPKITAMADAIWPRGRIALQTSTYSAALPVLDDQDAIRTFSAFDGDEVAAAYAGVFPEFQDKRRDIRLITEKGWNRDEVTLWMRTRALVAAGIRMCEDIAHCLPSELSVNEMDAYTRLRTILGEMVEGDKIGKRTFEVKTNELLPIYGELLNAAEEVERILSSLGSPRKLMSWRATIDACRRIIPSYRELASLRI